MRKYFLWVGLALLAVGFSKTIVAEVVPIAPATIHEDVIVVFDDDLLQQQMK